jgi:hypothetical protein
MVKFRISKVFQCRSDCNETTLLSFNFTSFDSLIRLSNNSMVGSNCSTYITNLVTTLQYNTTNNTIQLLNETYIIENSVVESIFSAVDPVFLKLYKFFNLPGAYENETKYSHDSNSSYALQTFYDTMNSTVNNITVILNSFLSI